MHYYGNAQATANRILEAFKDPGRLPKALAPIFLQAKRAHQVPCRRWSIGNQVLVALALTEDARGFKQWKEVGRKVKKGAKAFHILAPCTRKIEDLDENGAKVERFAVYGFRAIPVFALEDTEGDALPGADPAVMQWIDNLPLVDVARAWGLTVDYTGENPNFYGLYAPGRQRIVLAVENLSTFFHEFIHAADHRLGNLKERGQHWRSEIVAELGGAILAECLGLHVDADLGGCYDYIQRYAEAAEKSPIGAAMDVLDRTCKAVALVLEHAEALQTAAPADEVAA